jgi:hypothetical protein
MAVVVVVIVVVLVVVVVVVVVIALEQAKKISKKICLLTNSCWFHVWLTFYSEDGGGIFLRNFC